MKRTPMAPGKGFKRPVMIRAARAPLVPVTRGVVVMCTGLTMASPKEDMQRSSTYEAAVRKLPCARCGVVGFTQFCHADEGKGMGIKTDVRRGWAGCGPHHGVPGCHYVIGTGGTLLREDRRAEERRLAEWTRAEIVRLGVWPARLPAWVEQAAGS